MSDHVITFHDDGTASTLWTDKLPLEEIGTLKVRRASWIEFNERTQKWEVRFNQHAVEAAYTDPSRTACLVWENAELNKRPPREQITPS